MSQGETSVSQAPFWQWPKYHEILTERQEYAGKWSVLDGPIGDLPGGDLPGGGIEEKGLLPVVEVL